MANRTAQKPPKSAESPDARPPSTLNVDGVEMEVVRDLTAAEKKFAERRYAQMQRSSEAAQRAVQQAEKDLSIWNETVKLITGEEPRLGIHPTEMKIIRLPEEKKETDDA